MGRRGSILILLAGLTTGWAAAQTTDDFFDPGVVHEIRLTMTDADWRTLHEQYLENTYYPCNFEWGGILVENVGVRSRGAGSRNAIKPGLAIDFNRFDSAQAFLGLKSVQLKNSVQDASLLKERLSMTFFRQMGLPAPRVVHARVYVNGDYAGLYVVVESVDKRFLKSNFGEDSGYLYSYEWDGPYNFEYRGPDPEKYSPMPFKPQTREKDPDPQPLVDMIRTMNEASDEDFPVAMAAFLDLKLYMMHAAIENYLAERDGIVGDSGLANFYLYRFAGQNLSQFIVWDKDNTFRGSDRPIFQNADINVLMRRAVAVTELRDAYLEALLTSAALAGGAGGWLEQEISNYYDQIRDAAYEDSLKQCSLEMFGEIRSCSNEEFDGAVAGLLTFAQERQEFVLREVAAARQQGPAAQSP